MEASFMIAKMFGIYFAVIGLAMVLVKDKFNTMIKAAVGNAACNLTLTFLTLILGIILIVFHNYWGRDWRLLITILAWITFVKGVFRLYFPESIDKMAKFFLESKTGYNFSVLITAILSVYCLYYGYFFK